MQFTLQEFLKRHAGLFGIHYGTSNTNVLECLDVNLRTVLRIRKKLDESNGDYKATAAWKPHSDCSDKERTPKFVGKIQIMIDYDPSKLIRSLARHMGISEFPIR